eukprot:TRINITY_DN6097_c0_g1_i4.p2 TRINITY_DN6097_c0_g1~~TRINITY_DN6097_c0_g1_i4.p2  ORF type:complete len:164 (+),score=8.97 TRINITY_DN6097_c0_g1_i4:155-646(+)
MALKLFSFAFLIAAATSLGVDPQCNIDLCCTDTPPSGACCAAVLCPAPTEPCNIDLCCTEARPEGDCCAAVLCPVPIEPCDINLCCTEAQPEGDCCAAVLCPVPTEPGQGEYEKCLKKPELSLPCSFSTRWYYSKLLDRCLPTPACDDQGFNSNFDCMKTCLN